MEAKYGKYIVQELKTNRFSPEFAAKYATYATRILWMDDQVVEGAFQMNCCWFVKVPEKQMYFQHQHDVPEIIGLFGGDFKNQHDMGAEVEFWMEDEKYTITKSCMIFVPAGVKHCPLILKRVDRPIFHFTVVTSSQYTMVNKGE